MSKKIYTFHLTSQVAQGSGTITLGKEGAEDSPNLEKMKRVSKFLKLQIKPK